MKASGRAPPPLSHTHFRKFLMRPEYRTYTTKATDPPGFSPPAASSSPPTPSASPPAPASPTSASLQTSWR